MVFSGRAKEEQQIWGQSCAKNRKFSIFNESLRPAVAQIACTLDRIALPSKLDGYGDLGPSTIIVNFLVQSVFGRCLPTHGFHFEPVVWVDENNLAWFQLQQCFLMPPPSGAGFSGNKIVVEYCIFRNDLRAFRLVEASSFRKPEPLKFFQKIGVTASPNRLIEMVPFFTIGISDFVNAMRIG
ncbi:hypothetical protein BMI85_02100 [Thioclava sp. DLFJ4-1]|nr:hypothetical protein BMI85_02100 [Thioclava sp. DLFJ4-1]OOY33204.1 hypothetical protein BMI88_04970 [Thioclava sp. F36-6]